MNDNKKLPSVKKNFLLNTMYQVFSIITPFITAPYLSRVLGVETIGINSYVHSILYIFTMFAKLGTEVYGSRAIAQTRDDKEKNTKVFWEIEILSILTSSIVLIAWIILIFFSGDLKIYCIILSLNIFSVMISIYWFFAGQEKFKYVVIRNTLVKIVGIILIFLFVKKPEHLARLILINSGIGIIANSIMWIPLKKYLVKIDFKTINIWPHFKETLVYFIPSIASSVYHILDKTLLGLLTNGNSENGFYEQSNKIIELARTLSFSSLTTVMTTRISYLFSKNNIDEIKKKIYKSFDFIIFMSIGCCFGIIGVAKTFVPIFFGSGYDKSIIILQLLSPVLLIISVSACLGQLYFVPAGLRKKSCYFEIAGAIVNLILNLLLIPKFESIGAVIGTLVAELIITILYLINANNFLTIKGIIKLSWKKLIAAILMLIYLLFISHLNFDTIFKLVAEISGGVIIYLTVLLILNDSMIATLKKIFIEKLTSFSKNKSD